jgi:predicted glycoside hydrolase/deacetylase ChbG (UPF0249 family)
MRTSRIDDRREKEIMQFGDITLTSVGVRGIVPEGWSQAGDGRFNRGAFAGDPTMLYEEAFPHVDIEGVKATMASTLGLDAFPERTGTLETSQYTWDLHTFEIQLPHMGRLVADFCLAQDGTWVYFTSLATTPDEHDALYKDVLLPVTHAFSPLPDTFGLINGGVPDGTDGPTLAEQLGYARDSVLAIVHADDMALHRDQTDGALEAMELGMCKTGSVMVPCPDFDRTLAIWVERPDLDLGIHLTLNSEWGARYGWAPVLPRSEVPSLYSSDGIMWPTEGKLREHLVVAEALQEMEAQILRVLEAGVEPTHVDDHMGCYWLHPDLKRGAMQLARQYNLPMNPIHIDEMRQQGHVVADAIWMFTSNLFPEVHDPSIRSKVYDDWMRGLKPGVHLLLTHIARESADLCSKIPMAHFRVGDHAYWTSSETKALADELGIIFAGYRELQRLQARNWSDRVEEAASTL